MRQQYLVTWTVAVDAESPEDAARQARAIQLDSDSDMLVFDVDDPENCEVFQIDLGAEEEAERPN